MKSAAERPLHDGIAARRDQREAGRSSPRRHGLASAVRSIASPAAGMGASVDVQHLARDEGGPIQIQHRLDDLFWRAQASDRVELFQKPWASGLCMGVSIMPGATALVWMPSTACSMASALVTPLSPALVRIGKAADTPATG